MLNLLLCIAANVGILTCFRLFGRYRLDTFQAIVFNYLTCVLTGICFVGGERFVRVFTGSTSWLPIALVLGGIFIGTFYLMARTTQVYSMTVSSVAVKMSLIIPVLFSLLVLGIKSKEYSVLNYIGLITAFLAIYASSVRRQDVTLPQPGRHFILPVSIFILGGIIDTTINFVNHRYLTPADEALFPILTFFSAAVIGVIVLLIRRTPIRGKNILGGFFLGVVNYFSMFCLIRALTAFENDGAMVYPLLNVGIILFSTLISGLFFKEHFSRLNIFGVLLALLTIIFLSYQELLAL